MSRFCSQCGSNISDASTFCRSCGTRTKPLQHSGHPVNHTLPINSQQPAYNQLPVPVNNQPPPYHQPPAFSNLAGQQPKKKAKRQTAGIIAIIASGLAVILLFQFVIGPMIYNMTINTGSAENFVAKIDGVTGQPYAGRAVTISGEGFGYYDPENSLASIDGKDAPIIRWSENEVTVIVPSGIKAGQQEVVLSNPLTFDKKSVRTEFLEHKKTELESVTLSPSKENRIEGDGFTLIVPAGSIGEKMKIVISKYDAPSIDDSLYYTVTDEYEITGSDGEHVFFDQPVFFSLDVEDEEEALQTSYQIFDEYAGLWVKAETVYVEEEGRLYLVTTHFSGFRKFVSVMYQGAKKMAGEKIDSEMKKIEYVYEKAKSAKNTVVKLTEEAYVAIKDATTEKFVGVSDADQYFIVYYRVSDAKNDTSIPDTAREMAAAFSTAYIEYRDLFGEASVPPTSRTVYVHWKDDEVTRPDPIRVYIDPRYTGAIAKTATTGNIIMPSKYREGDMASTCAHELFHAVQYHQLGIKQLYMGTTGLKDLVDNRYTGNNTEVYRFFANNMWFFEASAEYAGRFVGTKEGIGAPIHRSIDASKPYYAYNGYHDYGVSSFLDYILATRQPDADEPAEAFKEMWNTVTGNYSMLSSVNVEFDGYVQDKLGESANQAYLNFWREAFTRSYMPEIKNIAGGLIDVNTLNTLTKASPMKISEDGAGIFRYNFEPKFMRKDETAMTRSFWFEASPASLRGDIYRLDGLEMSDRVMEEPFEGTVNDSGKGLQDVLVPYHAGDTFGLVAVFYNSVLGDAEASVTISSTTLSWDNQEEIEKKVGNTTLKSSDMLEFTPTLPEQKSGDAPFTAVVILNNNDDYKTEIDRVENGKPFEVDAPMKDLPPGKITVNIKIFKDETLVHEYQLGDKTDEATVTIEGSENLVIELTKDQLPYTHTFTAAAQPGGEYSFQWDLGNGLTESDTANNESSISSDYSEFNTYEPYVTLYDLKGNQLATAKVSLTLKEKTTETVPQTGSMDGKWIAYEMAYGGGDPDPLSIEITLSISGSQFTMTKIDRSGESWSGSGYVKDYIDASGDQAYQLIPDTGNKIDDSYFGEYFGLENYGLFVSLFDDGNRLSVGTSIRLIFKRE